MTSDSTDAAALAGRMDFMELDSSARASIHAVRGVLAKALPGGLDRFYERVRAFEEARRFFRDEDHIDHAKARQLEHWARLTGAEFDESYVVAVRAVGEAHARIGLEPRWYIGGYAVLLESLIAAVVDNAWPEAGLWGRKREGAGALAATLGSLVKAALLDMDFAISVYIDAAEQARRQAEETALTQMKDAAGVLGDALAKLAAGDLTYRIEADMPAAARQMKDDFNAASGRLQEAAAGVTQSAEGVSSGADELARATDDLSRRTEHQAATLEETAAALEQITATVHKTAQGAGDAGKGFAVVASDVRALAQRSAGAAREIKTLIASSTEQVSAGVALVGRTQEALQGIGGQVLEMDAVVAEIASAAREQAVALGEVNQAVLQMDQVVQQNAAMVEQSMAATVALQHEAAELASQARRFRTGSGAAAAPRAIDPVGDVRSRLLQKLGR